MKEKKKEEAFVGDVNDLVNKIDRKYGKGLVSSNGSDLAEGVTFVPTSIMSVDYCLGGGIPMGRMIECYGPESSGKTSFCLHTIGVFQKLGKTAAFIDAEYAYDPNYASHFGVDTSKLLLTVPDNAEQALDIVEDYVLSGLVNLIVIDSVAALVPKAEIEGDMGDSHMGLQARLISQACRKLAAIVGKRECAIIWINQIRMKIGIMYGNPETTPGGNALKFYCSQRIDVRRIEKIPKDGDTKGILQRIKVVKNKVGIPFREAEVKLFFAKGYGTMSDMIDTAINLGVIERNGAWYSFNGQKFQMSGIANLDKSVLREIRDKTKQLLLN